MGFFKRDIQPRGIPDRSVKVAKTITTTCGKWVRVETRFYPGYVGMVDSISRIHINYNVQLMLCNTWFIRDDVFYTYHCLDNSIVFQTKKHV